jgi:hypothetical protein
MGLQTEFALGAQLLEDVELGTAHMIVGDENQRDDARGGFRAVAGGSCARRISYEVSLSGVTKTVAGLSVPGMGSGSPARVCCGRSGSGWAQPPVPAAAPTP